MDINAVRFRDYTKEEWRDIARRIRPDWTDADYDIVWDAFVKMKCAKTLN